MMPEHGRGEHAGSREDNNLLQMKLIEAGSDASTPIAPTD
jgi:hypothetical protein